MVVKYQVERRPIGPTGKIHYGREYGDGVAVLSNPEHPNLKPMGATAKPLNRGERIGAAYVPMNAVIPPLVKHDDGEEFSHMVEQIGEPWLVHSTHHSVDSAIESAAPLAAAIGATNVRIIKVLNHTTEFKLN